MDDFTLNFDSDSEFTSEEIPLEQSTEESLGDLSIGDFDFSDDSGASLDLEVNDGSDVFLQFGTDYEEEDDIFDASTLLRTELDISEILIDYVNYLTNARQKIIATATPIAAKLPMPSFADFSFISVETERRMVYGFFCSMLEDLCTEEVYSDLSVDEAYKVLVAEMYKEIYYTPNVYADSFYRIFSSLYESNKRLANAQVSETTPTLASLVDMNRLDQAELVYTINSVPFNWVTRFFDDLSVIPRNEKINPADYGELCAIMKNQIGGRVIRFDNVLEFIGTFLTSEDTLALLHLTSDQGLEFSIGELLRRYIVHELNTGDFYPTGMETMCSQTYSDELLGQLYRTLITSVHRQSFAAELLVLILQMMHSSAVWSSGDDSYRAGFTVTLSRFLSSFINDHTLTNPVFYSYIGYAEEEDGKFVFTLGYAEDEESLTVESGDILCNIIGDNSNIYHIPLVYTDKHMNCVLCPPPEVVDGVRKLTPSGKISINGSICYKCEPTYAWMSTLSIASAAASSDNAVADKSFGHSNNPLLDIMLSYHNDFDTRGEGPKVIEITAPDECTILGIHYPSDEDAVDTNNNIQVCRMLNSVGNEIKFSSSTCLVDDDGGLIVRYVEKNHTEECVIILDSTNYQMSVLDGDDEEVGSKELPSLDELFSSGDPDAYPYGNNTYRGKEVYWRCIAQNICDLNALDYQGLLNSAREVIMRDLSRVINIHRLDNLLGALLVEQYIRKFSETEIDSFNLQTLKELCNLVFGESNVLSKCVKTVSHDVWEALKEDYEDIVISFYNLCAQKSLLSSLDFHTLAAQICSRNELQRDIDRELYYALHYVPEFNRLLTMLENQMVILKALNEIGQDIISVLRKSTPILNCYKTVATKDSISAVETSLKTGMKDRDKDLPSILSLTRAVLSFNLVDNYTVLKYFVLEHNLYGVLTELEECFAHGDNKYRHLYDEICKKLSHRFDVEIRSMTEHDFHGHIGLKEANDVFISMQEEMIKLVMDGLVSEISTNIDLQVVKVYDIFINYGKEIFNLSEKDAQDFTDTSEFEDAFYSYVGSFLLTYCPIIGVAVDEIDGGFDRYSAYLRNRKDYICGYDLQAFESYHLHDLKLVSGLETGVTLVAQSGNNADAVDPEDL